MLTGDSESQKKTKKDKAQPGCEGCKVCPRSGGAWGWGGDPSLRGPSWNCTAHTVWEAGPTPPAPSPTAPRAWQGCASVPIISPCEKSSVIAELLFHCCYCFLITPSSFFNSGTKLNPANLKLICGVIRWHGNWAIGSWACREGEARGEAGTWGSRLNSSASDPVHGRKPSLSQGPGQAFGISP